MRHRHIESKWWATTALLLALPVVFLFVLGCDQTDDPVTEDVGGGVAVAPEATPAGGDALADRRMGKGRRDGHHGRMGKGKHHLSPAAMLLRGALRELDLTDEQRAELEALRDVKRPHKAEGHGKNGPAGFHQALIQALETGELDRTAFEQKLESKHGKFEQGLEARNRRLAALHGILTPEQRQQLVAAVRARLAKKMERHGDKGEGDRKGRGGHGRKGHGCAMIGKLTRGLDLTAEQQVQVDALIAKAKENRPSEEQWTEKRAEKHAQINSMLDAFAGDDFDPAASAPTPKPMKDPAAKMAFKADQIEALIGILTAEQRAQATERIKRRAGKMGHGKKGYGKMGHGEMGCGEMGCGGACDCPFADDDL
jgi:Spy/CpxP family protein refolding chaperone